VGSGSDRVFVHKKNERCGITALLSIAEYEHRSNVMTPSSATRKSQPVLSLPSVVWTHASLFLLVELDSGASGGPWNTLVRAGWF
jgi:hypothetical protein